MNSHSFDEVSADPDAILQQQGVESVADLCVTESTDSESVDLVSEVNEEVLEELFGDLSAYSIEYVDSLDAENT